MKKLLIIGNGFDLHCRLNTRYSDFYEHLKGLPSNKVIEDNIYKSVKVNIWWLLFYVYKNNENNLWKDIEELMYQFLFPTDNDKYINIEQTILFVINNIENRYILNPYEYFTNPMMQKFISLFQKTENYKSFIEIIKNDDYKNNKTNLNSETKNKISDILMSDLKEIENEFSKFLDNQIKDNSDYANYSNELFTGLTNVPFNSDTTDKIQIISFNYTRPGITSSNDSGKKVNMKNIHGTYLNRGHKDIIFGVEAFGIDPNNPFYIFTKTYRVSLLLNEKDDFESSIVLKDSSEIIIYGHSLGKQDYAYFFAIFNVLDLNGSDITLTFFYKNHDNINQAPIKQLALQKLIQTYEKEFNIPPQLYHRLLLENRVFVKEYKGGPFETDDIEKKTNLK